MGAPRCEHLCQRHEGQAYSNLTTRSKLIVIQIDLKATATCFHTTYDTLENKMRKIKKLAATLKSEVDSGARGEVESIRRSATSTPKKTATPSKALSSAYRHA